MYFIINISNFTVLRGPFVEIKQADFFLQRYRNEKINCVIVKVIE